MASKLTVEMLDIIHAVPIYVHVHVHIYILHLVRTELNGLTKKFPLFPCKIASSSAPALSCMYVVMTMYCGANTHQN